MITGVSSGIVAYRLLNLHSLFSINEGHLVYIIINIWLLISKQQPIRQAIILQYNSIIRKSNLFNFPGIRGQAKVILTSDLQAHPQIMLNYLVHGESLNFLFSSKVKLIVKLLIIY